MRKKCVSCGFICFITDETCKRCGSDNLAPFPQQVEPPEGGRQYSIKPLSFWNYLVYFLCALVIEFVALLPILSSLGMRHTSGAPVSNFEFYSLIIIIILHLPTLLITWSLGQLFGEPMMMLTPFMQILFWTFLFGYIARRKRTKAASNESNL